MELKPTVYNFRVSRLDEADKFTKKIFTLLGNADQKPDYRILQEIYEDDGRGNIRDFIYASYSLASSQLKLIFDRNSAAVLNFRFRGETSEHTSILCEQVPSIEGQPLRIVGETSNWYRLTAESGDAERIIRFIISECELNGMEGLKTEEDTTLNDYRVKYILAGHDPHLVWNIFSKIHYKEGLSEALTYLEEAMQVMPEFAKAMERTLQEQKIFWS